MKDTRPSVLVIGAGPAGCLAAIRLAREGFSVRMIDRRRQLPAIGETLSPDGRMALAMAGIWQRLPVGVALRCSSIATAWEHRSIRYRSFLANPYGPAWHLDRARFDAWLLAEAISEGVEFVVGAAQTVTKSADGWVVAVDGVSVNGTYLVVATGRSSAVTTRLAHRARIDSLALLGGFTQAVTEAEADARLLIEAVPHGWWYSMPVPDGRFFAGLMIAPSSVRSLDRRSTARAAFAATTFTRQRVREPTDFLVKPAVSASLQRCAGDDWIAVGDAALSRDPLSGDGIAAALRSGWKGAETVIAACRGDHRAWAEARTRGTRIVEDYLLSRAASYGAQTHWSETVFWSNRRSTQSQLDALHERCLNEWRPC